MSGGTGYGVTNQGFVLPQLTDLQKDLNDSLIAQFGAGVNLNPQAVFGQISGIVSERLSLVWQAMQDVYASQVPDTAFGASLDNVGALRGIPRLQPTKSLVQNFKLFGVPGTSIPTTTQFSVLGSPASIFTLNGAVVLGAGQNCVQTIVFSATPGSGSFALSINGSITPLLAYNISAADLQTAIRNLNYCSGCIIMQNSPTMYTITFAGAATGGLQVQPLFTVASNTVGTSLLAPISILPNIVTPGIDQANTNASAIVTGPVIANAKTLSVIVNPLSGLTNVLNTSDATLGTNVESDNAYRVRMNQELQVAGAGTIEAIRSRLLKVPLVTSALVYENVSQIVDSNGRPPHSFEAVVNGGSDADIGNTIWAAKDAGIATFGSSSYEIVDSQGIHHIVKFSRPTKINIYMNVSLLIDSTLYPANGDALVKQALDNYINSLGQGVGVIVTPLLVSQLAPIPGIDGATILIGTSPGPTLSNNIPIQAFQQAFTQISYINISETIG